MKITHLVTAVLAATLLYGVASPAGAGGAVKYEDGKRGFACRVPESFKQNPLKSDDPKYKAAEFYDDQAKYKSSGSVNPQFWIGWWSTPKGPATPSGAGGAGDKPMSRQEAMDEYGAKSIDEVVDQEINNNPKLFGSPEMNMSARWASAKKGKAAKGKIEFQYVEINAEKPKKKADPEPIWYLFVARLQVERPAESIEVTFHGYCATQFVKNLSPVFLDIVKSFETKEGGGATVREEVPDDPDKFREYVKRTKLVAGWKCMDSPNKQYVIFYADGVNEKVARTVAEQIESLRAQVYEAQFPSDRPIKAVSQIRICADGEQYRAYGAPPQSGGYWSSWDQELVFFETGTPKDVLRVLYHEAFHQYIYYSAGAVSPHSWFNEGHGDYYYGHDLKNGKWVWGKSLDRTDTAARVKREGRAVPLKEWLHWTQAQYYARIPDPKLTALENYALGWDFITFLRTTKKPEYQGIIERYFKTLKGLVTAAHDARVKEREKAKAEGNDPGPMSAQDEDLANRGYEDQWLEKALAEGFKGVDLDQLHKDWLAFEP